LVGIKVCRTYAIDEPSFDEIQTRIGNVLRSPRSVGGMVIDVLLTDLTLKVVTFL
jgi:hypothetical protein